MGKYIDKLTQYYGNKYLLKRYLGNNLQNKNKNVILQHALIP